MSDDYEDDFKSVRDEARLHNEIDRLRAKVEELDGMWRAASKGSAELLVMLERVSRLNSFRELNGILPDVRAIIAKAKGETA